MTDNRKLLPQKTTADCNKAETVTECDDGRHVKPVLVFRNVQRNLNVQRLSKLCENFATVVNVSRCARNRATMFAEFATTAEMQTAYNGLRNNTIGFRVDIARDVSQLQESVDNPQQLLRHFSDLSLLDKCVQHAIKHQCLTSRPKLSLRPLIRQAEYNNCHNLLQCNDVQHIFLTSYDDHALERNGHNVLQVTATDSHYYQTGRAVKILTIRLREQLEAYRKKLNPFEEDEEEEEEEEDNDEYAHDEIETKPKMCGNNCSFFGLQKCSRCYYHFCSKKCHDEMSVELRTACSRLVISKNKQVLSKAAEHADVNVLAMFPNESTVIVTCISSNNVLYIRSKLPLQQQQYVRTISQLQLIGPKLLPLAVQPKAGQLVVALYDNRYHRCIVLQRTCMNNADYLVGYIDYGNIVPHAFADLFGPPKTDPHFRQRFVLPVQLKSVVSCKMNVSIRKFVYQFLNERPLKLLYDTAADFDINTQRYRVELVDLGNNKTLNEAISIECRPVPVPDSQILLFDEHLAYRRFPAADDMCLMIMDNSIIRFGILYLTTPTALEYIQAFQVDIQRYVEDLATPSEFRPRYKQLCIAKYALDQKWYRAYALTDTVDSHANIMFLDYGQAMSLSIKDIRPFATVFSHPIYTARCELQGLPEICTDALETELKKLLPVGKMMYCDAVKAKQSDNEFAVTMQHIIQRLQRNDFVA